MFKPRLHIKLFSFKVNSFLFFGSLGFVWGLMLGLYLARVSELPLSGIWLMSITGAITFFGLTMLIKILTGIENIVYYHHEICILLLCFLVLRAFHFPVLPYLDISILGIGTFLAFGRIGCFNVGCCHGNPSRYGCIYGQQHVEAGFTWFYKDIPLLPVQLIESAFAFMIVCSGSFLVLRKSEPGTVLIIYTAAYGIFRFFIEFLRGDGERPFIYGLSEAQWTTVFIVGFTLLFANMGWLPYYSFHTILFILLLAVSLYVILRRGNLQFKSMNPRYVSEIAGMLKKASEINNDLLSPSINVYHTGSGVYISKGQVTKERTILHYYTISSAKKIVNLNARLLKNLALIIKQLEHYQSSFRIVGKQNNFFHIIFEEQQSDEVKKEPGFEPGNCKHGLKQDAGIIHLSPNM